MKRIICLLMVFVSLFMISACGDKQVEESSTENSLVTNETQSDQTVNNNAKYHSVDPYNSIYMYMNDNYRCAVIGNVWDFYDGETVVTYSKIPSFEESTQIKDIQEFYDYIPCYFDNILPTIHKKYDFKKLGEKTINGIKVREFEGTIIDDGDQSHPSKAYTFNYNGEDIIVIAVSMENNNAMKNKMEKDLEYFMTHLKFGE